MFYFSKKVRLFSQNDVLFLFYFLINPAGTTVKEVSPGMYWKTLESKLVRLFLSKFRSFRFVRCLKVSVKITVNPNSVKYKVDMLLFRRESKSPGFISRIGFPENSTLERFLSCRKHSSNFADLMRFPVILSTCRCASKQMLSDGIVVK